MVVIVVLGVALWLAIPIVLSRAMARFGYDGCSYLVVGALFGPFAAVFAAMEVLFDVPEPARILEEGRISHGELYLLVVVGGEPTTSLPTLAGLGARLRRVGLAQVLPKGGPRADERRAGQNLRQVTTGFDHPQLALLFGRPDVVVAEHAAAGRYNVVVTARPDPILSARLTEAGRIHGRGEEMRLCSSGRFPLSCWPGGTEALAPSPAARIRPARTA